MKKLFLTLFILLCVFALVQADNDSGGWDTAGGGIGDATTAAVSDSLDSMRVALEDTAADIRTAVSLKQAKSTLVDSLQNDHPEIKADTLTYKYANKTTATYWDLYNDLEVDSLAANGDSIKVWSRPKFTTAEKDTAWRLLLQGYGDTGDDSLLLGNTGYAVVDNPDTAKIWLACSDTTNCRIDLLVTNSNGDTVFYDYDIVLTGGATMTEYSILAFGAEVFDANERYCVMVKVYLDTGDWAIIGKARCVG